MLISKLIVLTCCILNIHLTKSLKILQFVPGYSRSHLMFNNQLARALANQGHNLTLYVVLDPKFQHENNGNLEIPKNVNQYILVFDYGDAFRSMFKTLAQKSFRLLALFEMSKNWFSAWNRLCDEQIEQIDLNGSPFESGNFDIALIHPFDTCLPLIVRMLNISKCAIYSPGTFLTTEYYAYHAAVPMTASFIPQPGTKYSDELTFLQRLSVALMNFLYLHGVYSSNLKLAPSYYPAVAYSKPPYLERSRKFHEIIQETASNMLINGYVTVDFPRPLPYGVYFMSQFNIASTSAAKTSTSNLDDKWTKIVNRENSRGIILFSLGTIAKSSELPHGTKMKILACLGKYENYSVIWRYETTFPEARVYGHISVEPWVPQKDLLSHPNMKLFISHGGYNSIVESVRAAVPMVIIPIFLDQFGNGQRMQRLGLARLVEKDAVSKNDFLSEAIDDVLTDATYSKRARKMAAILNDSIANSDFILSHRLKFIVRHDRQIHVLKSAQNLYFYEYHNFDIIFILFGIFFGFSTILA